MVAANQAACPKCAGHLRYFDRVKRVIRTKKRQTGWIQIRRLRCVTCGGLHRELPVELLPMRLS